MYSKANLEILVEFQILELWQISHSVPCISPFGWQESGALACWCGWLWQRSIRCSARNTSIRLLRQADVGTFGGGIRMAGRLPVVPLRKVPSMPADSSLHATGLDISQPPLQPNNVFFLPWNEKTHVMREFSHGSPHFRPSCAVFRLREIETWQGRQPDLQMELHEHSAHPIFASAAPIITPVFGMRSRLIYLAALAPESISRLSGPPHADCRMDCVGAFASPQPLLTGAGSSYCRRALGPAVECSMAGPTPVGGAQRNSI